MQKTNMKGRKNVSRNSGLARGVTRAYGEHLNRDEIKKRTCKHISDCPSPCTKCQENSETLIDLTVIGNRQFICG